MSRVDVGLTARVTLADVAEQAGVSLTAASLALRGKPGVGDDTRRRVTDVATSLGYRTRQPALAGGPATIGLLVKARLTDVGETNAFYGPVIAGISEACATEGIAVRLGHLSVDEHFDPVEAPRLLEDDDVHGLLVLGAFLSEQSGQMLGSRPVVLVDGYATDAGRFASVVSDNEGGVAAATARLIGLGHQRIAMVGTTPDAFPSIRERRTGYLRAVTEAGLEPIFVDGPHDDQAGATAAALRRLEQDPGITAVVAANDLVALGILAEHRDRVPRELSVVGFDDIDAASLVRPRLDTVAIDKPAMGRLAVSLLRHRMAHASDPAFTAIQRASLVVRESSAPPLRQRRRRS
jgi:LacI family transcriptional regulator